MHVSQMTNDIMARNKWQCRFLRFKKGSSLSWSLCLSKTPNSSQEQTWYQIDSQCTWGNRSSIDTQEQQHVGMLTPLWQTVNSNMLCRPTNEFIKTVHHYTFCIHTLSSCYSCLNWFQTKKWARRGVFTLVYQGQKHKHTMEQCMRRIFCKWVQKHVYDIYRMALKSFWEHWIAANSHWKQFERRQAEHTGWALIQGLPVVDWRCSWQTASGHRVVFLHRLRIFCECINMRLQFVCMLSAAEFVKFLNGSESHTWTLESWVLQTSSSFNNS